MRILLLGKNGQVGWELAHRLEDLGELTSTGREQADLADLTGLAQFVKDSAPDVIVNAAAYTQVDRAETERELATRINSSAPALLAQLAADLQAHLIHFSTDYVFDGSKDGPYVETDPPRPINHYGQTKLDGELAIAASRAEYWIFRTSWVYSLRRPSFVSNVLSWARQNSTIRIVDDQYGSPTWCRTLADVTADAIRKFLQGAAVTGRPAAGVYHVACQGSASRFALAQRVIQHAFDPITRPGLERATSDEFPTDAQRPENSALDCHHFMSTFGITLPTWEQALSVALENEPD